MLQIQVPPSFSSVPHSAVAGKGTERSALYSITVRCYRKRSGPYHAMAMYSAKRFEPHSKTSIVGTNAFLSYNIAVYISTKRFVPYTATAE